MGIPPPDNAGLYEHNTYIAGGPQTSAVVDVTSLGRTSGPDYHEYQHSDWQFGVSPAAQSQAVYRNSNVWPYDGYAPRETSNRAQEVAEQNHDTV